MEFNLLHCVVTRLALDGAERQTDSGGAGRAGKGWPGVLLFCLLMFLLHVCAHIPIPGKVSGPFALLSRGESKQLRL